MSVVFLVHKAGRVNKDHLETKDFQDLPASLDHKANLVNPGLKESAVSRVLTDLPVFLDLQARKVYQVNVDQMENKVLLVPPVIRAMRDPLDDVFPALPVRKENLDLLDQWDHLARRVFQVEINSWRKCFQIYMDRTNMRII